MKKCIFLLISLLFLINCSNENTQTKKKMRTEVLITTNKIVSKRINLQIDTLLTLEGDNQDDNPFALLPSKLIFFDNNNFFYFFDKQEYKIRKYNFKGDLILKFGSRGNGPGEYVNPSEFFILNNIVHIYDSALKRIVRFDNQGNFVDFKKIENKMLSKVKKISNDRILCYLTNVSMEEGKIYLNFNLSLINDKLEILNSYKNNRASIDPGVPLNPLDMPISPYTGDLNNVYSALKSTSRLKIDVFNLENNELKQVIQRNYTKSKYTDNELKKINKHFRDIMKSKNADVHLDAKKSYKDAIQDIHLDKYGNLLVSTSVNGKKRYDVYNKGVLQGYLNNIPTGDYSKIQFDENYLIIFDENNTIKICYYRYSN